MVKVTWTYPQDNGAVVEAYMVEFRAKDDSWATLNDTCDGSLPSIVAGKYCYVHMQNLKKPLSFLKRMIKLLSKSMREILRVTTTVLLLFLTACLQW